MSILQKLTNWKFVAGGSAIAAVAITLFFGNMWHDHVVDSLNKAHKAAVDNAVNAEREACNKDKEISKQLGQDYEESINNLNGDIRDYELRQTNPVCAKVITSGTGRNDDTTPPGVIRNENGLSDRWLVNVYARDAELTRVKLLTCQAYVKKLKEIYK